MFSRITRMPLFMHNILSLCRKASCRQFITKLGIKNDTLKVTLFFFPS